MFKWLKNAFKGKKQEEVEQEEIEQEEIEQEEIGQEEIGQEEIGQEEVGQEEVGQEEVEQEEVEQEEVEQEEVGQEEVVQEEVGQEEVGQEEVEQEEVEQEEVEQEEVGQEEVVQEEVGQEEVGQEEVGQEEVGQEELEQEEVGQEEVGQEEVGQEVTQIISKDRVEEVVQGLYKEEDFIEETIKEVEEVIEEKTQELACEIEEVEQEEIQAVEDTLEEPYDEEIIEEPDKPKEKLGFFAKLKKGLEKTRDNFTGQINNILKSYHKIDEDLFEDLEEILITSDVGMETTMTIIDNLRDRVQEERVTDPDDVMDLLKDEIKKIMTDSDVDSSLNIDPSPAVVLVVGVNGVGKTTTIGKMANSFKQDGKKVLIAAGDTFRAAAIEQLEEWGNRAGVDIISHSEGSDPAAVIYDGVQAAKARKVDVLICDTAGRLHNKSNLMNELNKIFRVVENEFGEARKEILLVLDATTGQNALSQAKVFKEVANITGIVLTKLDGTAKGGVVIGLQSGMGIPIKLVGIGEGIDDLQAFNTDDFVEAMFEN